MASVHEFNWDIKLPRFNVVGKTRIMQIIEEELKAKSRRRLYFTRGIHTEKFIVKVVNKRLRELDSTKNMTESEVYKILRAYKEALKRAVYSGTFTNFKFLSLVKLYYNTEYIPRHASRKMYKKFMYKRECERFYCKLAVHIQDYLKSLGLKYTESKYKKKTLNYYKKWHSYLNSKATKSVLTRKLY